MAKKKPLYGVSNYKKDKPRKRPGRHKKRLNKHEKRMKKRIDKYPLISYIYSKKDEYIFLDKDPKIAAQLQCDKHVVKMVLETAQMLSTAARKRGFELGYKSAYPKHPMTLWISESPHNYSWAIKHGLALGTEYQLRYHKVHKSHEVIKELAMLDSGDSTQMTKPPQCMPDEYKCDDYVQSYRNYYVGDKKRFARYTNRGTPEFMQ